MDKTLFEKLAKEICEHFVCCNDCPFSDISNAMKEKSCGKIWKDHQKDSELALATWIGGSAYVKTLGEKDEQKTPETRREILQAAERCVCGGRDQDYGGPEDTFSLIARLWEPLIKARCAGPGADVCVDAVTVALLMAELKIARATTNEMHMDSWVDLAGYAACGGEIAAEMEEKRNGD